MNETYSWLLIGRNWPVMRGQVQASNDYEARCAALKQLDAQDIKRELKSGKMVRPALVDITVSR